MTHKSEDYKISAVKYYLNNKDNIRKTCKIFDCKKSTLQRWIQRYKTSKNLIRRNRKSVSYKITKPQVKTALELLKQSELVQTDQVVNITDHCTAPTGKNKTRYRVYWNRPYIITEKKRIDKGGIETTQKTISITDETAKKIATYLGGTKAFEEYKKNAKNFRD